MLSRPALALAAAALVAACASTPQTAGFYGAPSFDAPAWSNLSRIELTQNYQFEQSTLPGISGGILAASSSARADQHDAANTLPGRRASRIQNVDPEENADILRYRASTEVPDGWRADGESLVHLESGLSCPSEISIPSEGQLFVLDQILRFDAAGRDVACSMRSATQNAVVTVYASYWPDVTAEEHAAAAAAAIYQSYTVEESLPVSVARLGPADDSDADAELYTGLEEPIAGGFSVGNVNGAPYKTSFWVVKTHDWHVKVRATYPKDDVLSELVASLYFSMSHLAVRAKNLSAPTAPGVEV